MKKTTQLLALAAAVCLLTACSPSPMDSTVALSANFIPKDSANKMIRSYQASIALPDSDTTAKLSSLIVNAEDLRSYLADTSITQVKMMFAHTLNYINSGHVGLPAGYRNDAFTLVLAGVKANGDYVYGAGTTVLNRCVPCPYSCMLGKAASPLLD